MSKVNVYSPNKKTTGTASLPKEFTEKPNEMLVAQAVHVYRDHLHPKLSKVKTRGEVSLTGKKIYRQKGTGGARHGAKSAPIFVGGGKAHGPKGLKRIVSLPQKMRQKALLSALSMKAENKDIVFVDGIEGLKKTKDAKTFIEAIALGEKITTKKKRMTLALGETALVSRNVLSNIPHVNTIPYKDLNAYHVMTGGTLVIDKSVFAKETKKQK